MNTLNNSSAVDVERIEIASEWLFRLHAEEVGDAEIADWIQWCERDPQNLEAFEEVQAMWKDYGELPEAAKRRLQARRHRVAEIAMRSASKPRPAGRFEILRRIHGWRPAIAVAFGVSLIGIAIAITAELSRRDQISPVSSQAFKTPIARNEEATLPDGSIVAIGAKSSLSLDFAAKERRLRIGNGQAYFKVAPDRLRPFVVDAGPVHVRAIGTAFDVRKNDDRVVITVTEGTVEVLPSEDRGEESGMSKETRLQVLAGYQLTWAAGGKEVKLNQTDPASATAWRTGRLEYFGEPLWVVVSNVNRYSTRQIVIAEEELGRVQFTGTVFVRSIDDWIAAIQQAFDLTAESRTDGSIAIRRRSSGSRATVGSAS